MMRRRFTVLLLTALLIALGTSLLMRPANSTLAQSSTPTTTLVPNYEGKVTAPEFQFGADWINVKEPLTMAQLRGKVVLLDFWTYGCINCIHIIPDLKRLETEFENELIVVGVHSAKFKNEGSTANIREVVQRYEVTHPVVNDSDFYLWDLYNVQAWPTTILIDPLGKVLGFYSGEGVYDALQPIISTMITQFDARKLIDRTPIKYDPELAKRAASPLSFPGKVLADAAGGRLFISDSNHNRVIVVDLKTSDVQAVIGSGVEGLQDGAFTTATFYRPQGLALDGNILYVADTENHAIRAVDLKAGSVKTIAGTGQQAAKRSDGGAALKVALSSPWDVAVVKGILYIAMAGTHQLWTLDLKSGTIMPFAGSGQEGLEDAPLNKAKLAQPSGMVTDGKILYFTDPEASAIRKIDLDANGPVTTIVGMGLFEFGDIDGKAEAVRLQHALGVTLGAEGKLYVADTYNSKIKLIDPATRESKTVFGGKSAGSQDGKDALFNEPGGLSFADGKLYIADTNNNVIRVADLSSGQVSTIVFPNAEVLNLSVDNSVGRETAKLPAQTVAPGTSQIIVNITTPSAFRLNDTAPFELHITPGDKIANVSADKADVVIVQPKMPLTLPVTLTEGTTELNADADVYYCDAINDTLCYVTRLHFTLPITVAAGGASTVKLEYTVIPPKTPNSTIGGK